MEYTVISIDDSRAEKRNKIHENITLNHVCIDFCDGRKIDEYLDRNEWMQSIPVHWQGGRGENGIWLSQAACWAHAADFGDLLVIEDDAIIGEDFMNHFDRFMQDLPDDWDFFALWKPPEQEVDYYYNNIYDDYGWPKMYGMLPAEHSLFNIGSDIVTKAYQGYSSVCNGFSQRGANKILDILGEKGIYTTADCWLFLESKIGFPDSPALNAYGVHPKYPRFVEHDGNAPSLKHI
jgi:hypothetical protein